MAARQQALSSHDSLHTVPARIKVSNAAWVHDRSQWSMHYKAAMKRLQALK
jgi:hypothetical protein